MIRIKSYYLIFLITLIGGALRFIDLGVNPLWTDESMFARWSRDYILTQEYPTVILAHYFGFTSEFWLRFLPALAGTLTIPAIYLVAKYNKIWWALLVSVFPLFIFWSRTARPYAFAGLFLVLGWRYWWSSIIAILTTPIAIMGVKITKKKIWYVVGLVLLAVIVYVNRPDASAQQENILTFFTWQRMWYLPLLTLIVYLSQMEIRREIVMVIIIISIIQLPAWEYQNWYSKDVRYSDWRNAGQFTFATNAHVSNWYSGGNALEFKEKFIPLFKQFLNEGYKVSLGMDFRALYNDENKYIIQMIPNLDSLYGDKLRRGEIVRLRIQNGKAEEY